MDKNFKAKCDSLKLRRIYEHQQAEHVKLMNMLQEIPDCAKKLPFHLYIAQNTPVHAIKQEALDLLWHQRLLHCGSDTLKDLHHHVDAIPDMSKFSFDDVNKCATCLQAKNHKHGPGHGSLRDTATIPYQGLYIDFAHAGQVSAKILDRGSPSKDSIPSKTTQSRMTVPATIDDLLKLVKQHTHKLLTSIL